MLTLSFVQWFRGIYNMKQSSRKQQATIKQAKSDIKKATIALRNKRKGGKRIAWEAIA